MDRPRPPLLLTRPQAQSARFAAAFRARFGPDWPIVVSPLTEIRFLDPGDIPQDADGLIFTSQNSVAAYARLTEARDGIAWCVGPRTAEAARDLGFSVRTGPGDAAGLARTIASGGGRTLLYPRGTHIAHDLTETLNSAGIETIPLVVYDQPDLPPADEARALLTMTAPVLLPLFSPRSARIAADHFAGGKAPLLIAAMSAPVAEACTDLAPRQLQIAAAPDADAMLDALQVLIAAPNTA